MKIRIIIIKPLYESYLCSRLCENIQDIFFNILMYIDKRKDIHDIDK